MVSAVIAICMDLTFISTGIKHKQDGRFLQVYCMRTLTRYSRIKLHGPMHYKVGVTGVFNGNVFYTLL